MNLLETEVRKALTIGRKNGKFLTESSRQIAQILLENDDEVTEAALDQFGEAGVYNCELAENAITEIIDRIK